MKDIKSQTKSHRKKLLAVYTMLYHAIITFHQIPNDIEVNDFISINIDTKQ